MPKQRSGIRWLVLFALGACQNQPPPPLATPKPAVAGPRSLKEATRRDPEAMDEGLRVALGAFRDRFACNDISGCPSEAILVGFGWSARPYLEQLFAHASRQASYRARSVHALADLRDPQAQPFFEHALGDADPEVRAYAIYGLGQIGARQDLGRLRQVGAEEASAWNAAPRLSALWVLRRWGDAQAEGQFIEELQRRAAQPMAGPALAWGLELCERPDGPVCDAVLPAAAGHANFTVRRAAIRAIAARPSPAMAPTLISAAADPVHSLAERAEDALRRLSGRDDLHGAAAWRRWCDETHCSDKR